MIQKLTSHSILVLGLLASLSSLGCIGLTGASKTASNSARSAPTGHFVQINWTPSDSDVAAYYIYRSQSAAGPFKKLASTIAVETEFTDKTVEVGQTYYYVITAVSSEGMESSDSTMAYATVP